VHCLRGHPTSGIAKITHPLRLRVRGGEICLAITKPLAIAKGEGVQDHYTQIICWTRPSRNLPGNAH